VRHTAIKDGYFRDQIVPVQDMQRRQPAVFHVDEHVMADTDVDSLAKMRPAFRTEGNVTARDSSGLNDSAAALVLASEDAAR
jgi:acetyl-CoA C-acetyltransferase